jgi:hypothetical protein
MVLMWYYLLASLLSDFAHYECPVPINRHLSLTARAWWRSSACPGTAPRGTRPRCSARQKSKRLTRTADSDDVGWAFRLISTGVALSNDGLGSRPC